jgi:hypothetical protein
MTSPPPPTEPCDRRAPFDSAPRDRYTPAPTDSTAYPLNAGSTVEME